MKFTVTDKYIMAVALQWDDLSIICKLFSLLQCSGYALEPYKVDYNTV